MDTKSAKLLLLSIAIMLFCVLLVLVSFAWLLLDVVPRIAAFSSPPAPLAGPLLLLACALGIVALWLAVRGFSSNG